MSDQDFLPPQRPARKPGQQPTAKLTLEAYVRLRKELDQLRSEGRTRIADRLLHARELGDIRENAEYDSAKNEQALMEARIRDLERKLKDPEIVEAGDSDEAIPGSLVTLRPLEDDEEDEEVYLLAHSAEERAPGVRTITVKSPLGSALVGRRVGEVISYEAPGGVFSYRVVGLGAHRPG